MKIDRPGAAQDGSYKAQDLVAEDIDAYLEQHRHKSMLRFITCGSVDDGKSTLIGRLLYDSKMIFEDQVASLEADSRRIGRQGQQLDFSLLVDGLSAEREQGITIDVAYRFFSTEKRKFIVADTPGHEQYTRNMVTGASTADLAVILVDACKGVLTQTRRHSYLVHLIGIRNIVVVINKMDMVGYSRARFDALVADYGFFAKNLGIHTFTAIPISALNGDNITELSQQTPWYAGPALLDFLENVPVDNDRLANGPLRMAVQWVNRPNSNFRGLSGFVNGGRVSVGEAVRVFPSGAKSTVSRIVTYDGDLASGVAGQSLTLCLSDEIDCSRGDVITSADAPVEAADQFEVTLIWLAADPMLPGRSYLAKLGPRTVSLAITEQKYEINVNTLEHLAAKKLELNGIGVCNVAFDHEIPFTPYCENPELGSFMVIDRISSATVGAGIINFSLRRAHNIRWQSLDIDRQALAAQKHQQPRVAWLTGISGAGKSTIANLVAKRLYALGKHAFLLDGDNVRHGLNRDLGFTEADRVENIRRVGEVAKLMTDAGLIVITALISPFQAERNMVRRLVSDGDFIEVYIDTPLEIAEQRDVKGLYSKARAGKLKNFTGIDSPYEAPSSPELHIDTTLTSPEAAAQLIVERLLR